MKFGKQLQNLKISEWEAHYISYKGLKKVIKSLCRETQADTPEARIYQIKTAFYSKVELELEEVNSFYLQKDGELQTRIKSLVEKKKIVEDYTGASARLYNSQSAKNGLKITSKALSSLNSLKEAFSQFLLDLTKLQVYYIQLILKVRRGQQHWFCQNSEKV